MTRIAILIAAALAFTATLPIAPAHAQRDRTFVASYGTDTDNTLCSFGSPCKTFQNAYANTAVGGEVTAIDSAGFGPLNITSSITITSPNGVEAGIVPVLGGNSITINANSTDAVTLQGLTLDGGGVGQNGIVFNNGGSLTVENCVIRNAVAIGLNFSPTASSSLLVSDTLLADNGGAAVQFAPIATGTYTAVFNRVEANNNAFDTGIRITGSNTSGGSITAAVSESTISGNIDGIVVGSSTGQAVTKVTLFHSVVANNSNDGIVANGTHATLTVAQSAVTGNAGGGWFINNGVIQTYQDNYFNDNGANTGILTNVSKQ